MARRRLSGLQTALQSELAGRVASSRPVAASQSLTFLSKPALANRRPSGLQLTARNRRRMPVQGEETLLAQAAQIIPLPAAPVRFIPLRPPVVEQIADASQPARPFGRLPGQVHLRVVQGLLQIIAGHIGFAAGLVGLGFFV